MMTYVFENHPREVREIYNNLNGMYGLSAVDEENILESDSMLVNIGEKFTNIILLDNYLNIHKIKKYFWGNYDECIR